MCCGCVGMVIYEVYVDFVDVDEVLVFVEE